jgi:hypothetical protein
VDLVAYFVEKWLLGNKKARRSGELLVNVTGSIALLRMT